MRRLPLFFIASAFLAFALACGGGSGSSAGATGSGSGPGGGGGGTQPGPVAEAHYVAVSAPTSPTVFYGSSGTLTPVFIVAPDGSFRGELDGFQHLRGALVQNTDGTVSLTGDCTWTDPQGNTQALTLSGSLTSGGHLTGTSNAGGFDLALSSSLDTPLTIDQVAGTYVTQATSNGVWAKLVISAPAQSGNITGMAYATQADAMADTNAIGSITGTLAYADADPSHLHNVWNIGFNYTPSGTTQTLTTYGLACFNGTTLVSLAANHLNPTAGQFSCTFAKQ